MHLRCLFQQTIELETRFRQFQQASEDDLLQAKIHMSDSVYNFRFFANKRANG